MISAASVRRIYRVGGQAMQELDDVKAAGQHVRPRVAALLDKAPHSADSGNARRPESARCETAGAPKRRAAP
jgi:hypothetical protein